MRKFIMVCVLLIGVIVPINDDFVDMMKRNMPDMTAQDEQLSRDYFAQIDSGVSHFTGGDTLEVEEVIATHGEFIYPPLSTATYVSSSQSIDITAKNWINWTTIKNESGKITKLDKTDNTKLLIPPGVAGNSVWMFVGEAISGPGTLKYYSVFFYDKDDVELELDFIFWGISGFTVTGTSVLTVPATATYFKVSCLSDPTANTTFTLHIIAVGWQK